MPRKTVKKTSEKKHTTVPPKAPLAKAAETESPQASNTAPSAAVAPATPVTALAPEAPKAPEPVVAAVAKPLAQPVTPPATEAVQAPAAQPVSAANGQTTGEAISRLVAALRDPDADRAREAATSLGASGDRSAVEPLIEVLGNADGYFHCVVRAAAAQGLGQLADPRAVEPLLRAVHDTMAEASAEAVRALASIGDRRAVPALVEIVRNRDGFYVHSVRHTAVLALSRLGGAESDAELTAVAHDAYESVAVREAAQQAVRNAGQGAASTAPASDRN